MGALATAEGVLVTVTRWTGGGTPRSPFSMIQTNVSSPSFDSEWPLQLSIEAMAYDMPHGIIWCVVRDTSPSGADTPLLYRLNPLSMELVRFSSLDAVRGFPFVYGSMMVFADGNLVAIFRAAVNSTLAVILTYAPQSLSPACPPVPSSWYPQGLFVL